MEYSHETVLIVHLVIVVFIRKDTLIKYYWTGCWYILCFQNLAEVYFHLNEKLLFEATFGKRGLISLPIVYNFE